MGQKTNPLSLRLQTNKERESIWFNQFNYSSLLLSEILCRKYLKDLMEGLQLFLGKSVFHICTKRLTVHTPFYFPFYQTKRVTTYYPEKMKIESIVEQNPFFLKNEKSYSSSNLLIFQTFFENSKNLMMLSFFPQVLSQQKESSLNSFLKNKNSSHSIYDSLIGNTFSLSNKRGLSVNAKKAFVLTKLVTKTSLEISSLSKNKEGNHFQRHAEKNLSVWFGYSSSLFFSHFGRPSSSADWLAKYLVYAIQNRDSFKRASQQAIQKIKNDSDILGVRLVCSGRFGGAEMARTETRQHGTMSLHVFSEKVDYAQQTALTSYGIFGLKVWVCYV